MKNILLTGHKGFVGQNLAQNLKKYKVFKWGEEDYKENWQSKLFDLLEDKNIQTIFHVGANSSATDQNVNKVMFLNYQTTKYLSDWAKFRNRKFIYSSSAACYGTNGVYPTNLYGWSKKAGEDVTVSNKQVALRYFNIFGPGEGSKGATASVALQAMLKSKKGETVELFPGKPSRDFIYIKDVVQANLFADEHYEELKGKCYDTGTTESHTFEDVMEILQISYTYLKQNPHSNYQDYTCAKREKLMPGWAAQYDLRKALTEYQTWFKNS